MSNIKFNRAEEEAHEQRKATIISWKVQENWGVAWGWKLGFLKEKKEKFGNGIGLWDKKLK